jgi:exopolyphosphatase
MSASTPSDSSVLPLQDFLQERKNNPTRHIVIGNEAGDADSIISAITFAYVEFLQNKNITPIISIPRRDLETQRPETTLLLKMADVLVDSMLFVDDESWKQFPLNVSLVDHNRLASSMDDETAYKVLEILDHHKDEGRHLECSARTIAFKDDKATVASTCTLVLERLQQFYHSPIPVNLAVLLLGVILLDSVNMNESVGKGTPRDASAIQSILESTDWAELNDHAKSILQCTSEQRPDPNVFFGVLQNAKFDPTFWHSLSGRDALRLDYKSFRCGSLPGFFGMSTVLMPMKDFLHKQNLMTNIENYMRDMQVEFLGILLAHSDETGSLHREVILVARNTFPLNEMVEFLRNEPSLKLANVLYDVNWSEQFGLCIRCFTQGNNKASRKQVVPILFKFFKRN